MQLVDDTKCGICDGTDHMDHEVDLCPIKADSRDVAWSSARELRKNDATDAFGCITLI